MPRTLTVWHPRRQPRIGFADRRDFHLVGTDGGLLAAPQTLRSIQLSPGERAEIVAAFRPGERAVLRSFAPKLGTNFFLDRFSGGGDSFDVLEIRAAAELAPSPRLPNGLAPREPLGEQDADRTRSFGFGGRSINGRSIDESRIDEVVAPGSTEVCELRNKGRTPHNFRIHGVTFDLLEYGGGGAAAGARRPRGHAVSPARQGRADRDPLRRLRRSGSPVHVPLRPPGPRGLRHDGPVRRIRLGDSTGSGRQSRKGSAGTCGSWRLPQLPSSASVTTLVCGERYRRQRKTQLP